MDVMCKLTIDREMLIKEFEIMKEMEEDKEFFVHGYDLISGSDREHAIPFERDDLSRHHILVMEKGKIEFYDYMQKRGKKMETIDLIRYSSKITDILWKASELKIVLLDCKPQNIVMVILFIFLSFIYSSWMPR